MDEQIYKKLTKSAKLALEETIQEFSDTILEKAYENANNNNVADKEISLHDIIEAKIEILSLKNKIKREEYRKRRLLLMVSFMGIIYTIFGICFYILQKRNYDITKDFGLIIAGIGTITTMFGLLYIQLFSLKNKIFTVDKTINEKNSFKYEIISKWEEIENLGTELMLKRGISDNKAKSINFIVDFLSTELSNIICIDNLKILLITRNKLIHTNMVLSNGEIKETLFIANEIIGELKKQIKSQQTDSLL